VQPYGNDFRTSKYDLHIFEICKSAQELSKELAADFLSKYMLKCSRETSPIPEIVDFFSSYDIHKSHGRSIDRNISRENGLKVINVEEIEGLADLVHSLYNQYELFFDKSPFYKVFENTCGISWGRQSVTFELVPTEIPTSVPQPGPPERSG